MKEEVSMGMDDDLSKYFRKESKTQSFDESGEPIEAITDGKESPEDRLNSIFEGDNTAKKKKSVDIKLDKKSVTMSVEEFDVFMTVLRGLQNSCEDVIIKDGIISQFNAKRTFLIYADLRNVIGDTDLVINNLPNKYEFLSTIFQRQNVNVTLNITKEKYVFTDSSCKIEFRHPNMEYVPATYEDKVALDVMIDRNLNKCIFNYNFQKLLITRIIASAKMLSSNLMYIIFDENGNVKFDVQPLDTTNSTVATLGIMGSDDLHDKSLRNLRVPVLVQMFLNFINAGCEEINTRMYHRNVTNTCSFEMFSNLVIPGSDDVVPFSIHSMMSFVPHNEQ